MRPHNLILATVLSVTTFLMPASAQETNPYPAADPSVDMIEGLMDAPVTMTVYVSPACGHCLTLMRALTQGVAREQLGAGNLRIVVRELPSIRPNAPESATDEMRANAERVTNMLAVASRCVHRQDATWVMGQWVGVQAYVSGNAPQSSGLRQWPYISNQELTDFAAYFRSQARPISQDELMACYEDANVSAPIVAAIQQTTSDFYDATSGGFTLPLIYVGDQPVDWSSSRPLAERIEALNTAIEAAASNSISEPSVTPYEQCRREEFVKTYWRMSPEDVPAMISGINNPSARPSGLPTSRSYWSEVSDIWGLTEYACARFR